MIFLREEQNEVPGAYTQIFDFSDKTAEMTSIMKVLDEQAQNIQGQETKHKFNPSVELQKILEEKSCKKFIFGDWIKSVLSYYFIYIFLYLSLIMPLYPIVLFSSRIGSIINQANLYFDFSLHSFNRPDIKTKLKDFIIKTFLIEMGVYFIFSFLTIYFFISQIRPFFAKLKEIEERILSNYSNFKSEASKSGDFKTSEQILWSYFEKEHVSLNSEELKYLTKFTKLQIVLFFFFFHEFAILLVFLTGKICSLFFKVQIRKFCSSLELEMYNLNDNQISFNNTVKNSSQELKDNILTAKGNTINLIESEFLKSHLISHLEIFKFALINWFKSPFIEKYLKSPSIPSDLVFISFYALLSLMFLKVLLKPDLVEEYLKCYEQQGSVKSQENQEDKEENN